jgi:hypothetical protein
MGESKNLWGESPICKTAAILSRSVCFLGTVGFGIHLARAVETPPVIIHSECEYS